MTLYERLLSSRSPLSRSGNDTETGIDPEPLEGLCALDPRPPFSYPCAVCGQQNDIELDLAGGFRQQFVEECAVCCRPNTLSITVDPDSGHIAVLVERA